MTVSEDVKLWGKTKDLSEMPFVDKLEYEGINVSELFSDESEEDDDDFYRSSRGNDLIHYLTRDTKINPYSEKYMKELRRDTETLSQDSHVLTILQSEDGIIPNDLYADRLHLALYLQEKQVINAIMRRNGHQESDEPLFSDATELMAKVKEMNLTEFLSKRLNYFLTAQQNSSEINLMIKVLKNQADEETVDLEKNVSKFFRILYNQKECLFLKNGLLLRVCFPKKSQKHVIQIVLDKFSAERRLVQVHSKHHRSFLYTYV